MRRTSIHRRSMRQPNQPPSQKTNHIFDKNSIVEADATDLDEPTTSVRRTSQCSNQSNACQALRRISVIAARGAWSAVRARPIADTCGSQSLPEHFSAEIRAEWKSFGHPVSALAIFKAGGATGAQLGESLWNEGGDADSLEKSYRLPITSKKCSRIEVTENCLGPREGHVVPPSLGRSNLDKLTRSEIPQCMGL